MSPPRLLKCRNLIGSYGNNLSGRPSLPKGGCGVIGYWRGLTARPAYLHIVWEPPNLSIMPDHGGEGLSSVNVETTSFHSRDSLQRLAWFSSPIHSNHSSCFVRYVPAVKTWEPGRPFSEALLPPTLLINRPFFCKN